MGSVHKRERERERERERGREREREREQWRAPRHEKEVSVGWYGGRGRGG